MLFFNTRKTKSKGRNKKRALLPPSFHTFLADRITDAGGLAIAGLGAAIGLMLLTWNGEDPSFNTAAAADADVANWLGTFGAYTSDLLLQSFGLSVIAFIVFFAAWGATILWRRPQGRAVVKFSFLLVAVLFLSIGLARVPAIAGWPFGAYLGGSVGGLLFGAVLSILQPLIGGTAPYVISATGFVAGTVLLAISIETDADVWRAWRDNIISGFLRLCEAAGFLARRSRAWHAAHATPRGARPALTPAVRKRPQIATNDDGDDEEDDEDAYDIYAEDDSEEDYESEEEAFADDDAEEDLDEAEQHTGLLGKLTRKKKPVVARPTKKVKEAKKPKQRQLEFEGEFVLPSIDLLDEPPKQVDGKLDDDALQKNAELLHSTLNDFGVDGEILQVSPGPVITLYELEPAPGTKSSRVIGLSDDIARSMSAISVRVAVVAGKNALGIELPNVKRETVFLREMLASREYERYTGKLPLVLGKNIGGDPVIADLARMPHLLVAGTTGSGKSVGINTMILSLLYRFTPEQCKFIMIDPKMLELSVYDDIPHLLTPVVTEPHKAITALKWAVREMENRYRSMSKLGVRNIDGYNTRIKDSRERGEVLMHRVQTGFDADTGKPVFEEQPISQQELPYIVVIVDEFADLMLVAGKEVENAIQRLAQMARAAGIHLIMATQRPSVDVITGVIKANFPTRISFQVTSKIDSRTILGDGGAETLLGQGDMLYMAAGGRLTRVHGPFVADAEVEDVVKYLKTQGEPVYIDGVTDGEEDEFKGIMAGNGDSGDDLYDQAVRIVLTERKASTSFVQRHLQIGYNRAARIIERMEKEGIISQANHVGKREILLDDVG